jgi:anaerobic selenocysteine-containing dehydrogenase
VDAQVGGRDTVWTSLKAHLAPYTTATVAGICGCTEAEIIAVAQALLDNSRFASTDWTVAQATPQATAYKATTILYAMGQTQHTNGSQNIKDLAIIQTMMGNMGRAGGGINALRGIHNVQGSTDMGLLFDSIPGYSGNPAVDEHYSHYQNALFGNRVEGTVPVNYNAGTTPKFIDPSKLGLQQRGFHNMTNEWFGKGTSSGQDVETLYELWPKGNGVQHIETFRRMVDTIVASAKLKVDVADAAVTYTAANAGAAGNAITVTVDATGPDQVLAASVVGADVTVTLGMTAGVVTSTSTQVAAIVNGTPAVAAVVTAVGAGAGLAVAKATTHLAGGATNMYASLKVAPANSAVTYTAVAAGDKGNAITITVNVPGADQAATYAESGNDITITLGVAGGVVTSTAANIVTLVNGASTLVTAAFSGDGSGIAAAKPQTGGLGTHLAGGMDKIKAAVVWGQNPAVTEPNQSKVRDGLKNLDLLVVVDMYETETAAVDRKAGAPTYLIPACSHVEEAGSVTNSGRWLQWRERATAPKGNSKADMELLLRFAYALDKAGAFTHITNVAYNDKTTAPASGVWHDLVAPISGSAYFNLYGNKYGWTPDGVAGLFEELHTHTGERWAPGGTPDLAATLFGSEVVCELIYEELCRPLAQNADGTANLTSGGTMWIYSAAAPAGGYSASLTNYNPVCKLADGTAVSWTIKNHAKSRNNTYKGASVGALGDTTVADANANNYPRWGWAWLLNRRVFYSNGEIAAEQTDNFVSPGYVSCLFTMNNAATALADWNTAYRKYKTFADAPSVQAGPHFVSKGKTFMGRFPGHTEPYESPREDIVADYGHNMSGTSRLITEGSGASAIGTVATYPLVLTTIRCVEHFQGGPTTRNNSWNVEAEPVPWIEINSIDARNYGISDGDWVNVITARSNSTTDEMAETPANTATWARGFKARVGVGVQTNQRVGVGVVAIPWHWGDKGLSTGSRANDLCIDAWDANTMIPEYKVCLCQIVKL